MVLLHGSDGPHSSTAPMRSLSTQSCRELTKLLVGRPPPPSYYSTRTHSAIIIMSSIDSSDSIRNNFSNSATSTTAKLVHQVLEEYQQQATTMAIRQHNCSSHNKTLLCQHQSSLRNPARSSFTMMGKKSVRFNQIHPVEIIPIASVKSRMPKRDVHRRWLNHNDYAKIKHDNFATLLDLGTMTMTRGNNNNNKTTTTTTARGLERLTVIGLYQYQVHHRDAVVAVLRTQQQNGQSSSSPEHREYAIAQAYRDETQSAIRQAIQLARIDQTMAEPEYIEDCPIATIRKIQQGHYVLERQRIMMNDKQKTTLVHQLIMKPARKLLSRSWSLQCTFL
jgi:hypothetical protein